LHRVDPSSDPILRVSSLFQFESALYHAFPSADGLNLVPSFQMHQDASCRGPLLDLSSGAISG
jgi:hypothetical protein